MHMRWLVVSLHLQIKNEKEAQELLKLNKKCFLLNHK